MIRVAILSFVVLSFFPAGAGAQDHPAFSVSSEATRSGDKITVSIKIVENKTEVVPGFGNTDVSTTRSSPGFLIREGQRAQMVIGDGRPAAVGAHPATEPADIDSGIKIDVISVKGQDIVLIVTTVIEDGSTVWAEATTTQVQPKPADEQK